MSLWLPLQLANQIIHHMQAAMPLEACGLLAGVDGQVKQFIPITNISADASQLFEMHQAEFVEAIFHIESLGMQWIGIVHSHPNTPPIPSHTDIAQWHYNDMAYVIVGMLCGEAHLAAWQISPAEVQPLRLHMGLNPPQNESVTPANNRQSITVLISIVLGVLFLITVSLVLLPPAPVIP